MKTRKHLPRRSVIDAVARRAAKLSDGEAAAAWRELAGQLDDLAITPLPKYRHVVDAIRKATITGKKKPCSVTDVNVLGPTKLCRRRWFLRFTSQNAARLAGSDAEAAWQEMSRLLDELTRKPLPEYDDVIRAIREATIAAQSRPTQPEPLPLLEPAAAHSPDTRSADAATTAAPEAQATCPHCGSSTTIGGCCPNPACPPVRYG